MLTSTYTLVALSVEQTRVRLAAQTLLTNWSPAAWLAQPPAPQQLQQACDALDQFVTRCEWRKLDRFVLPALRRHVASSAGMAQRLLAELDALAGQAQEARLAARKAAMTGDPACLTWIERCCTLLLSRIEREEDELVLVARNTLSHEVWRTISHQMLAQDVHADENRPAMPERGGPVRAPALAHAGARIPGSYAKIDISDRKTHAQPYAC